MTNTFARVLSATVLGAVLTGCATVPGDPYYAPAPTYYPPSGSTIIYDAPPVYRSPPPPVYVAPPPPVYYGNRRDERDWARERERERAQQQWREQAERERRDRERDRDRENARRDQERRNQAEREQARRDQIERDRRAAAERARGDNRQYGPGPHPNDWRARQQSNSLEKP
ncbi:type IV secretory pathway VirB10-like protein [Acidovorax soli]|jgi:type IV secretory pathway VirB10-like protein|uniref:Type IV secretory pathway VirB10-like protein n=1 Tax=Acidovorax soli TaxID=592050 RepID=A0A7X0U908_9BURK|nr:hypothetical protein [Acidovorax soli]MBB6559364.1 type IV secretory pathway VirB10-like protein [Acidovorax soli]